jgi:arginine repressor
LKTPTGLAQPLAVAIDSVSLREIAGPVAGDDTILVIYHSAADAASLERKLESLRR